MLSLIKVGEGVGVLFLIKVGEGVGVLFLIMVGEGGQGVVFNYGGGGG